MNLRGKIADVLRLPQGVVVSIATTANIDALPDQRLFLHRRSGARTTSWAVQDVKWQTTSCFSATPTLLVFLESDAPFASADLGSEVVLSAANGAEVAA